MSILWAGAFASLLGALVGGAMSACVAHLQQERESKRHAAQLAQQTDLALYEARVRVYRGILRFLSRALNETVSHSVLVDLWGDTWGRDHLFPDDHVSNFVERLHALGVELEIATKRVDQAVNGSDEAKLALSKADELRKQAREDWSKVDEVFQRYLHVGKRS